MNYGYSTGFVWPRLTRAVKALILINIGVFLVNAVAKGGLTPWFALSWDGLWDGYGLGLLRLLSYQFMHSFRNYGHIFFNMLTLYFFGTFVEEALGRTRFLKLYFTAGLVGGVMQVLLALVLRRDPLVVGASGCIYGVMVYAACMAPRMRVLAIVFPIELRWLVLALVSFGLYDTYLELVTGVGSGVANGGHLGGALWGFLAYRLPAVRFGWLDRLRAWQGARRYRARQERQEILDRLLDKVHREGMSALTPAERRFLNKASEHMRRR